MPQFAAPLNFNDALAKLAEGGWRVLAGGTDFYPALGDAPLREKVLDISGLGELREIRKEEEYWRFGALTTWTDVARANLPSCFHGLQLAAVEVGARQIQNVGTMAGNICNASPAADGVPPLLTLNAEVELTSLSGIRRLPLLDFIQGNRRTLRAEDEIMTSIVVPREVEDGKSHFLKLGGRSYLVISIAMVAALLKTSQSGTIESARISVGACSPVALRLTELEQQLEGQPASPALSELVRPEYLHKLSPIDDSRATAPYRVDVAEKLVRRTILACLDHD